MRILIVVHQFMPHHYAGTEVLARDTGLELLRRGHDVHVLTAKLVPPRDFDRIVSHDYDHRGLKVHAVELPEPTTTTEALAGEYGRPAVAEHVREQAHRLGPDVIHIFHVAHLGAAVIDGLAARG